MDIEQMRTIIYRPLKQQKLPKCIKKNFQKFSISTYDLIYPCDAYSFRKYINGLLDRIHKTYCLSDQTDNNMYSDAIVVYNIICHKLYYNIWTF